tara:strand:+ start:5164 stop:7416 length:2253 start_codon:yes stop_codon:yes gene_type:complete
MSKFIIEIRTKGFGKAEAELKRTGEQTRSFARSANNAKDAGATFRKEVSQLRNNMLLYAFAIGGTITAMGRFVKAASDAREQASKFRVVFGEFAPEADAFAQSITNSFGIAKSEMIQLLAGLQDTLVPLGFSREHASELSQSIAQLSLDVGSFNNVATGDVAQRFTSAIIGNHEAVRSLGIMLTETNIKQEAYRLGLAETGEELDQTAKVLGRMSLIYNNTTDAQGDAIRTQKEFAAQLRAVQGQLKEVKESIGESLMPFAEFALKLTSIAVEGNNVGIALRGATVALVAYGAQALIATARQIQFNQAVSRNVYIFAGTAFVMAIDFAMRKIEEYGRGTVEAAYGVDNLGELVTKLADGNVKLAGSTDEAAKAAAAHAEALEEQAESLEKSERSLAVRLAVMLEDTNLGKARVTAILGESRMLSEKEKILLTEIDRIIAKNKADKEAIRIAKEKKEAELNATKEMIEGMNAITEAQSEAAIIQAQLDGATDLQIEKMQIVNSAAMDLGKIIGGPGGLGSAYTTLKNKIGDSTEALTLESLGIDTTNALLVEQVQAVIDLVNQKLALAQANVTATDAERENAKAMKDAQDLAQEQQRDMAILASGILGVAAALKQASDQSMDFDQKLSLAMQTAGSILMMIPGGQVGGAMMQAGSMFIGHTGGLIKDSGIQRFATGGMVQGEDNVPIMAQSGEFIMQRSAVQNIGVDNLAAMNSGQSNGGVTVNIQGNMVGNKSFVRDVMIPEIQKSMNRA